MFASRAHKRDLVGRELEQSRRLILLVLQGLLVAGLSAALFHVVGIYGDALRDPRYLDGWILAGGMCLQLCFHISVAARRLSPTGALRWRKLHVVVGYLLIPAFLLHSDYSLPDTAFEWALWACFVLISLSGIFGICVAWMLRSRNTADDSVSLERIPALRAALAQDVHVITFTNHPASASTALPPPPYDAWIAELYVDDIRGYLERRPGISARLLESRQRLKRLTDKIDNLHGFVDGPSQGKLNAIRARVIEKDRLDAAQTALGLSRAWLLVHVPATYMLVVLSVVHVVVVYAFSSGAL